MRRIFALLVGLLLPVSALANESKEAAAAATHWLALVDAGKYAQSWDEASALFKMRVSEAQWESASKSVRGSLGPMIARKAPTVKLRNTLPGAPDGQYAILRFHTKFAKKAKAIETVTMMRDDGTWKASGYFIK